MITKLGRFKRYIILARATVVLSHEMSLAVRWSDESACAIAFLQAPPKLKVVKV